MLLNFWVWVLHTSDHKQSSIFLLEKSHAYSEVESIPLLAILRPDFMVVSLSLSLSVSLCLSLPLSAPPPPLSLSRTPPPLFLSLSLSFCLSAGLTVSVYLSVYLSSSPSPSPLLSLQSSWMAIWYCFNIYVLGEVYCTVRYSGYAESVVNSATVSFIFPEMAVRV